MERSERLSDRLEAWLRSEGPKTLGSLVDVYGEKSFAVLFILLLAIAALPVPTGGVTHVFEAIAMLIALQLIVGRRRIWLPKRLRRRELGPAAQERFAMVLLNRIRWLERHSRPRLGYVVSHRLSVPIYGLLVFILSLTAFVAPPFTGLDTLPAMGVVVMSAGILLDDSLIVFAGILIGATGVALVIALGGGVVKGVGELL